MLTDRRKVELCLIAAMLFRAASIAFERDTSNGEAPMPADNARCIELLRRAALEPIELERDPERQAKLVRRVQRVTTQALAPYEDRPLVTVFSVLLYWIVEETQAGRIEMVEGSPGAEAIESLIGMLTGEHPDLMARVERSATRQVPRFRTHLARLGYFADAIAPSHEVVA